MYQAVIFDMDGVIIDSEPIHFGIISKHAEELGFNITIEEWNSFTGMVNREIFAVLKAKHGFQQSAEELNLIYMKRFMEVLRSAADIKPIAGVDKLIKKIYDKGLLLAVASSATPENIAVVLDKFQLKDYFNVTVSGYEVEKSKPEPDIYYRAAEVLGVDPAQCIVIEDAAHGVKAAKAAGMKCIAYINPSSGNQDLSLADIVIDRFEDLDIQKIMSA